MPGDANKVFSEIWSPYCKGVSLLECPSSQAEKLRDDIRQLMKSGKSEDEVLKQVLTEHGELLRMKPHWQGREASAYWLPFLIFFFAFAGVIWFWIRRRKSSSKEISKSIRPENRNDQEVLKDLKEI